MKRAIIAAAFALSPVAANAQWIVSDPQTELNTQLTFLKSVQQVENGFNQLRQLESTVSAVAHGNVFAAASVVPELTGGLAGSPLSGSGSDIANMVQGGAAAASQIGSMASSVLGASFPFLPSGADYQARQIVSGANSASAQVAIATRMLDSGQQRQGLLSSLFSALGNTKDVKDATDANSRATQEVARQGLHTNQLLAVQVLQNGQRQIQEAQAEAAWRCSVENFVKNSKAAAIAAAGGSVDLIEGSDTRACVMPASLSVPMASLGDGPAGEGPRVSDGSGPVGDGGSMMAQPWGEAARANAVALGVNPDALAATCSIESNCRNVRGPGSVSGPWQMTDGTFNNAWRQASAEDGVQGSGNKSDPVTQSAAAAQELKNAANRLQSSGIQNPTVLDARGYYQFGPAVGATLAQASPSRSMSELLGGYYNQAQLAANGITPNTTVGQWRQSVVNKLGQSANAPVLNI